MLLNGGPLVAVRSLQCAARETKPSGLTLDLFGRLRDDLVP
jgi:hypothetical protein